MKYLNLLENKFFGNYFCILKERHSAFVCISKNGCTSLKRISLYNMNGNLLSDEQQIHDAIGYSSYSKFLVPVEMMPDYENRNGKLLKFAVWRDPVERLVSTYKWFILEKNFNPYFQWLDFYNGCSFERFLSFVDFELSKVNPYNQDEHIRKQSNYYKSNDVDVIVPIDKLDVFLSQINLPVFGALNNSISNMFAVPKEQIDMIHKLYEQDYWFIKENNDILF